MGISSGSTVFTLSQATAASATFYFVCPRAGVVNYVGALSDAVAASGESMSIDVTIDTTSCLSTALVLDDGNTTKVAEAATIAGVEHHASAGSTIAVALTYTAGGGPTPMTTTCVTVEIIH